MVLNRLSNAKIRTLAFLPLTAFVAQALHYFQINELGHMLWMCNTGNLVLAIGMFLNQRTLIRVAVMWMVPGLVVWSIYVVPTWGMLVSGDFTASQLFAVFSSSLAHVGGLAAGLIVLRRIGMDRWSWIYAFAWYLIMQVLSRLITPEAMNVNLSQKVQDGFQGAFNAYWKFWVVLTLLVGLFAWLIEYLFWRLWPAREVSESSSF
ncbi:MAG TPA: hypothetical protein VIT88_03040 [Pyrinomonadaceae bacterium]